MLDREELRERSMHNRTKNAERNRKALCNYIERGVYAAVNMGRTSVQFDMPKLRLMAFGDDGVIQDVFSYYRNSGLSIYVVENKDPKLVKLDISWD